MSKNLTRKSAALGAVVALGASLFAGTPAHAAAELTIAPATGTAYNVLANDAFKLKAFGNVDFTLGTSSNLNWKITKSATVSNTYTTNAPDSGSASTTPTKDSVNSTATVEYLKSLTASAVAGGNTLSINPATTVDDPTVTLTVQAWIEVDGDGLPSANELKSAVQTVKFLGSADVVATPVLSNAIVGQAAKVSVTIPGLNYEQTTAGKARVQFYTNGTADGSPTPVDLADNATDDALEASQASNGANNATVGVKVQAVNYEGTGTAWKDVSSIVYADVASSTADTVSDFGIKTSADIRKKVSGDYTETVSATSAYVARKGTKSFTVTQLVKKTTGGLATVVGAGVPVTVKVSEDNGNTVTTGNVISAGGKKFTAAAGTTAEQFITFQAVTDANGKVSVEVTNSVGTAGDRIYVSFKTQTGTSTVTEKIAVIQWKTSVTSKLYNKGNNSGVYAVTKTGSVSVPFDVLDDFGQSVATSTQTLRLLVTPQSNSVGASTSAVPVAWAGGVTNVVYNSTATATGSLALSIKLQYLDSATPAVYQDVSGVSAVTVNLAVVTAAGTPAKVTASTYAADGTTAFTEGTSTKPALTLVDYVSADLRGDNNTVSAPTQTWTNVISGYVTGSTGAPVEGAAVTVSGKGALFSVGGTNTSADADVYAADSITVYTNASGLYSVQIASHTAGAIVFSIASGSATAVTKTITFAAAAKTTGKTVTISAPSSVLPGRSVAVVVTVADKYGNAIDTAAADGLVSVSVAGVGYTTTIADNTDAAGQIKFNVILSSGDEGSITITAKYDGDATASTLSDNAAATASVSVGAAAVAVAAKANVVAKTKAFSVSVSGNAAAKNVVVKVAGKTVATLAGSASAKTYTVKATKGSKKVTVYVGGKLIATKTVSVK